MGEIHVVACVFANGESRIAATADLDSAFRQWRRRYGAFIPVAAFECDIAAFLEAAQIPRLPKTVSTNRVAELLHRAPVSMTAQPAVLKQIRWLGANAPALLAEWAGAVRAVTK